MKSISDMAMRSMFACMVLSCGSGVAAAGDRFESIREQIRSEMIDESVPSLAVGVAMNGRIVWEEGFGWADREKRIRATEHTLYSLASISKPLTATGLMTLVQAGKIDLDAPANHYLGEAKLRARIGNADDATVRRVANHTSGLPMHYQFFYADERYRPPSRDETILKYGNLVAAPGELYQYSNLGYGVLDYIIERVSGLTYAEFMKREVFLPLGMTHTSVDIGKGLEAFTATRYGPDGLPIPFYEFDHPGASAIFASAHDLLRFALFHLEERQPGQRDILNSASIQEMHRRTGGDETDGYGVGFDLDSKHGYRRILHSGGMAGVTTQMHLFPEAKLAIVALSNATSRLPNRIVGRIAGRLLRNWPVNQRRQKAELPIFTTPAALLGTWKGTLATYVEDLPMALSFLPNGEVHAKIGEQLTALVNSPEFKDGVFKGDLTARIGTADTERYDYIVQLSLKLRGTELSGVATASGFEAPRMRNALSHWVNLARKE